MRYRSVIRAAEQQGAAHSRDAAIRATREFMQLHADHWPAREGECELRELMFPAP